MMKKLIPLMLILAAISGEVAAQKEPMKYGKIPQEDLDMKVYGLDTSAAALVLGDYGTLEFQFKEDDVLYKFTRHKRIKILKRPGFDEGDIRIPFYSKGRMETVKALKAQVIAPDGKVAEVAKDAIFEEEASQFWSAKRFSCPNLQVGSIIEYQYDIISTAIFQLPEWYFQTDIPVRWSELRLEIPEWFNYVVINQGRNVEASEQSVQDRSFYVEGGFGSSGQTKMKVHTSRYLMKDVPALKEESFITTMDDYYSRIRFQLSHTNYPSGGYQPVLGTWDKVAEELMLDPSIGEQLTKKKNYGKVWETAQGLLSTAPTPEEKVEKLYDFILSNIAHEEGKGISVRKSLNDCFEKKSAFSHEMNLMLVALLKEAGIEAYPLLISTRSHGLPMPLYPLLEQFDHLMAFVDLGEKRFVLDVANPFRPVGYPAVNSLNGQGFLVKSRAANWVDILPPSGSDTYLLNMALDEEGTMEGNITMSFDGYSAINEREALHGNPSGKHLKDRLAKRFPDIRVDSIRFENNEDLSKPLKAFVTCRIPSMAQVAGDFMYLGAASMTAFGESPFKLKERTYPVDIPFPFKEQIVFNLALPEGYVLEEAPQSTRMSMEGDGGKFSFQASQRGKNLQLVSNLQILKLHFELEDYGTLFNFFNLVAEKMGGQVVLKRG